MKAIALRSKEREWITADAAYGSSRINTGLKIWTPEFNDQFHIN